MKAKKIKSFRRDAGVVAQSAINFSDPLSLPWNGEVVTHVKWFMGSRNRRPDTDNVLASLKAMFDGFEDAGIVKNDDQFIHLPVTIDRDNDDPRVDVQLWDIEGCELHIGIKKERLNGE